LLSGLASERFVGGASQVLWSKCQALSGGGDALKDRILWDSCYQSNLQLFHQNFVKTR
jgi:hypothetical protein